MTNEELMNVVGGSVTFSAALVTAIVSAFKGLYELGQSIGSSIRRVLGGKYCKIN